MNKLITGIERTGRQILYRPFLKVFLLGMFTTAGVLLLSFVFANEIIKEIPLFASDWAWWQTFVNGMLGWIYTFSLLFIVFIFFVPISTLIISIFLDDVIDCVEDKYYPHKKAKNRKNFLHLVFLSVRMMFFIIFFNVLVLPIYVLFFWVPFLSVIVFYLLNGYLLGWGYYEMIAFRHLGIKEAGVHRKSIWAMILLAGMIMTFLFMLPIVQFVAPIISVALICHLFHLSEFEEI